MNRNTRKFIWNGFWAIVFLGLGVFQLSKGTTIWNGVIFAADVILCFIHWKRVEETLKED